MEREEGESKTVRVGCSGVYALHNELLLLFCFSRFLFLKLCICAALDITQFHLTSVIDMYYLGIALPFLVE